MLSGRETLGHLDETFATLRRQLDRIDNDIRQLTSRITRSQLRQGDVIRRLARVRLEAIERDNLDSQLTSAERQVEDLLKRRDDALAETERSIAETDTRLTDLGARRAEQHAKVDEAARQLAEREAAAQSALEDDEAFKAQLERSQNADAVAVSAAEKATVAAKDWAEKRKPYDSDRLFSYLWGRKYGTEGYQANPIARLLDAWVARLIRYEQARRDYWMLKEIPKRLEHHAAARRDRADEALEALTAIEERVADEHNVPEARAALADAEAEQDRIDGDIEGEEQQLVALRSDVDRYALGEDDYTQRSVGLLTDAMENRSVDQLTSAALATMTDEDDALIDELRDARREERELKDELADQHNLHKSSLGRLQELADVRKRFKRRRYDDLRSSFENGDMLMMLLKGLLAGTTRGGSLWDALRRYQRYQDVAGEWPDFGSGGIGRRSRPRFKHKRGRNPPWHWPGRRGGSGGFRLPKIPGGFSGSRGGRGRSRGGFRTGGGF